MKVRVTDDTSSDHAQAIAEALADRFESDVTVVAESGSELGRATHSAAGSAGSPPPEFDDDLGPTEREQRLRGGRQQ